MATAANDRKTLASAQSWRATPDDYSSLRHIYFNVDGSGELTYGYGQTIYAVVPCTWEVLAGERLRLTYEPPTSGWLKAGFVLSDANRVKELGYTLTTGRVVGVQNIVSIPYEYDRTLELSAQPWPDGLDLPYGTPRVFYGLVAKGIAPDDAADAGHR